MTPPSRKDYPEQPTITNEPENINTVPNDNSVITTTVETPTPIINTPPQENQPITLNEQPQPITQPQPPTPPTPTTPPVQVTTLQYPSVPATATFTPEPNIRDEFIRVYEESPRKATTFFNNNKQKIAKLLLEAL